MGGPGIARPMARRGAGAGLALALLLAAWAAPAQTGAEPAGPAVAPRVFSQIAVIAREELFSRTAFGKAMAARAEAERGRLLAENQRLDAALEAEERDLTARRATMPATDFRTAAAAFDEKVHGIRAAQDAKARDLARQTDEDRQTFARTATPVLADLMAELGAAVLLDKASVVLSLEAVDITDRAIARIDAVLGDGSQPPADPPSPAPQP